MRHRHTRITLLLFFLLVPQWVAAQTFVTGTFSAAQQTLDVTSDAGGTAALALTDEGVRFLITVDGLSGDITAAHFHNASAGTDGGVVRTITDDFDGTTARGLWTANDAEPLTDELMRALLAGNLYLNLHTAANPAGEIRAQLFPTSGAGLTAFLTPEQQTLDVTSDAGGTAALQATDAGVLFFLTVDGLSGDVTAAHFHNAPAGTDGGVMRTITDDFDGNTAFGLWTANDAEPLTGEATAALLEGDLYLNLHTAANPAGEVRGQVFPSSGWGFTASLDAEQQTAGVSSDATGTASFTLTEAGLVFNVTVEGLSGPITAAHFHNAPTGADGPVVRTITGEFDGATAHGVWTEADDEPLTGEMMRELLAGNLYLNVHTAANPGGEIRGQITLDGGAPFTGMFSAAQQTADVSSDATGTASMSLTSDGLTFDVTVDGLSGDVTAAHFHNAPMGEDGGVVRTITGDFTGRTAHGVWTAADAEPLTGEMMRELLAGNLYLNVHTAANPGGEIRAQVIPSGGTALSASLTPEQLSALPTGEAAGTAALLLTDAGLAFHLTVEGLSGDVTAAHFHNAPMGEDGGVVRTITGDFDGNSAAGVWTPDDAEPLTGEMIRELLTGNLYLNVHTAANPGGETRGQVRLSGGVGSAVSLDPGQGTQATSSRAMGSAAVTLTEAGLVFGLTVEGLSGDVTAAHFHNAPTGADGPVVRTITGDFDGNSAAGVWTPDDAEPLTVDLTNELLAGSVYFNVHTAANPAGEVRGQILPNAVVVTALEPLDDALPETYRLSQNYPNPFNPSTTITFELPQTGRVRLEVFNVLGERVATLVDGPLATGAYAVTFDASSLPSGAYLYRLDAGGVTRTRLMMLVK
ncbi:CHRD domain-containing protein [Rhodocaloribacter sp.]